MLQVGLTRCENRERERALACSRVVSPARTQRHVFRVPDRKRDSAGNAGTGTHSASLCSPSAGLTTIFYRETIALRARRPLHTLCPGPVSSVCHTLWTDLCASRRKRPDKSCATHAPKAAGPVLDLGIALMADLTPPLLEHDDTAFERHEGISVGQESDDLPLVSNVRSLMALVRPEACWLLAGCTVCPIRLTGSISFVRGCAPVPNQQDLLSQSAVAQVLLVRLPFSLAIPHLVRPDSRRWLLPPLRTTIAG